MYDELIERLRSATTLPVMNAMCQEATDAIEELVGFLQEAERDRDEYRERLDKEAEYATALACNVPKWIPVTERLPEIDMSYPHHEDYLVQYDSGNMDVASWSNVNRFWTDHVTEPHWNCVQFAEVIAWMPLPQPPEVET